MLSIGLFTSALRLPAADYDWLGLFNGEVRTLTEQRAEMERELRHLGIPSVGQTVSELGFEYMFDSGRLNEAPWIQIDLRRECRIDAIALVPARSQWQPYDRAGYGFPVRFKVEISSDPEFKQALRVADYSQHDFPDPGVAPVTLALAGRPAAQFVKITVTKMPAEGRRQFFALAEVMVLSGNLNVAHARPVTTSIDTRYGTIAWRAAYLVDGRTPLGPPVRPAHVPREGFYIYPAPGAFPQITIDLGAKMPVLQVRLHPIHSRHPVDRPGNSFPQSYVVAASDTPDFAASRELYKKERGSNPGNNPVTIGARNLRARYIRVSVPAAVERVGFSEIEVYSNDRNVARTAKITATPDRVDRPPRWPESLLNDGLVSRGRLIELPEWLREWERRRVLSTELPRLERRQSVAAAIARQRAVWLAGSLLLGSLAAIAGVMIAARRKRERALSELQARFARDLHDEIGSNLAGIAILSGVARGEGSPDPKQQENWLKVQRIAQETTAAMREVLWMVGAREGSETDLMAHLRLAASRLLGRKEVHWRATLDRLPDELTEEAGRQVFLFFKEALANIARHSRAKRVELSIGIVESALVLEIADDGLGFDLQRARRGMGLRSLEDRARALRGVAEITSTPEQGTRIRLRVPLRTKRRCFPFLPRRLLLSPPKP